MNVVLCGKIPWTKFISCECFDMRSQAASALQIASLNPASFWEHDFITAFKAYVWVSLILSHHSRFICECNKEEMNDDDESTISHPFSFSSALLTLKVLEGPWASSLLIQACMSLRYEPASEPPKKSQHCSRRWIICWISNVDRLPREQKMLKGNLPRVIYHQVY